uniref:Uncharacterized protein n=1 Tax=Arundo donax TaxID=35708 RepID=A0A0A8Y4F2_ARUDO
MPDMRRQV